MTRRIASAVATLALMVLIPIPIDSLAQQSQREMFSIKGKLEKQDGSPVADELVYLFPIQNRQAVTLGLKFDDVRKRWGPSGNPKAVSDARGGFVIIVTGTWVANAGTDTFGVGLFDGGPRLLFEDREPPTAVVMTLDREALEKVDHIDLMTIFKRILVK